MILSLLLVVLFAVGGALADITNRTIDDTRGDSVTGNQVIYGGLWHNEPCNLCIIKPDPAQANDGTWTDTTYLGNSTEPVNATLTFTGTAIWVFFILANNEGFGTQLSTTAVNITLDDQPPHLFQHAPNMSTTDLEYNALVFSQEGLENVHHTVLISVSGIQEEVYINFDYAIYTHQDVFIPVTQPVISGTPMSPLPSPTPNSVPLSLVNSGDHSPSQSLPTPTSSTPIGSTTAPAEPSPSGSNAAVLTEHPQPRINVGVFIGGALGGLAALSLLTFGICSLRTWMRQKGANRRSINLFDGEENNSESRLYPQAGISYFDEDGIDRTVVPFPLGLPLPELHTPRSKLSGTAEMTDRSSMPSISTSSLVPSSGPSTRPTISRVAEPSADGRMDALRRARQQELDDRLQSTQQEMTELLNEIRNRHATQGRPLPTPQMQNDIAAEDGTGATEAADRQMSVEELQDALRHIKTQIRRLHQQQRSAWAQGLSDDPPPGYPTEQ